MSANGHLKFQGTNRATFVGTTSNIMFDTTSTSLGIGVTGTDHPSSNLYVTGNAYVSSNIAVGGVLTMGTVNVVARHDLEAVTALGNTTPVTLEFTNPTTSLVASGNVVVTGNVTADHFVGDGSNITGISSTLQAITDSGPGANVTSNTVQFSNATTGFVTTANVEVGGELTVSGNVEVGTANLFVDTVNSRVGIGTTNPQQKLEVNGTFSVSGPTSGANHSDGGILYLLDTPIIDEWSWTSSNTTLRITYASSELPANCKAVLAEVFMPKTNNVDHVGHSLGKNYNYQATWTSGAGVQPSSIFTLNRQTTFLDMRGDTDNFEYYYGKWFSSVIIPLDTGNTVYHIIGGESGTSTSWVYVVTRGYYI